MHTAYRFFSLVLLSILCCIFTLSVISPVNVFAQDTNTVCDPNNETCNQDLGDVPLQPAGVVQVIVKYSVALGGSLALVLIIYGGFKMVNSNGSPTEIKKAREIISYAIIGLVLILLSVSLVAAVSNGIIPIPNIGG